MHREVEYDPDLESRATIFYDEDSEEQQNVYIARVLYLKRMCTNLGI